MIDFKGHRFEKDIILLCVRWYLAYPLSYRNLEEMMEERGVEVDHSNIYRWVQKFTPALEIIGALLEAACNSSGISPARAPVSDHARGNLKHFFDATRERTAGTQSDKASIKETPCCVPASSGGTACCGAKEAS